MAKLKQQFEDLSTQEKMDFMKQIMPSMCEIFQEDPEKMMQEMMPQCQKMMQECDMDMSQMKEMMSKMQNN